MDKVNKSEFIIVRVEPEFKRQLESEAAAADMRISDFLREWLKKIPHISSLDELKTED